MTEWRPDTCKCVADIEAKQLIQKCKDHNTYKQTLAHNHSFRLVLNEKVFNSALQKQTLGQELNQAEQAELNKYHTNQTDKATEKARS